MKRVRVHIEGESAARQAGLAREQAAKDGFACLGCGTQQVMSPYIMANWGSLLIHTCQACGATHKMKGGIITLRSGPTKKLKRARIQEETMQADPKTPQWRAYRIFHAAGAVTYRAVSEYHPSLDACNNDAFDYATAAEPLSRSKRDDVFRSLLRREEFPLMSQVEHQGMPVGFGDIVDAGETALKEGSKETVHHFTLRDPKGRETIVAIRPDDFQFLLERWGLSK